MLSKQLVRLDRPISWICEAYEHNGKTEVRLIREGMTRDEIIAAFPPYRDDALPYNRTELLRSIIYEAYLEVTEGGVQRPRGNVRNFFWYERSFWLLVNVLGEPGNEENIASIDTTINRVCGELIEDYGLGDLYDVLNIYSEKQRGYRISVKEDSPYPTFIVIVEKENLFDELSDLADTYEISFCACGGQNSREAAMAYASKLERMGVDLTLPFTVFSYADFDPDGWTIPNGFVDHLRLRVSGDIRLVRLGILKEQLGKSAIKLQSIPYSLESKTEQGRKAKVTKYDNFVKETGGLFIGTNGRRVPVRVEMNIYKPEQLRGRIIEALEQHIEALPYQVRTLKGTIRDEYQGAWDEVVESVWDNVSSVYDEYFDAIRDERERVEVERAKRAPAARKKIAELREQISAWEAVIKIETRDLDELDGRLSELHDELSNKARAEGQEVIEAIQDDEGPGADDLIEDIDDWPEWMEEVGVDEVDASALSDDARKRRGFSYKPDRDERKAIRDWIGEQMVGDSDTDAYGPDETPDELIQQAIDGDDDTTTEESSDE